MQFWKSYHKDAAVRSLSEQTKLDYKHKQNWTNSHYSDELYIPLPFSSACCHWSYHESPPKQINNLKIRRYKFSIYSLLNKKKKKKENYYIRAEDKYVNY